MLNADTIGIHRRYRQASHQCRALASRHTQCQRRLFQLSQSASYLANNNFSTSDGEVERIGWRVDNIKDDVAESIVRSLAPEPSVSPPHLIVDFLSFRVRFELAVSTDERLDDFSSTILAQPKPRCVRVYHR